MNSSRIRLKTVQILLLFLLLSPVVFFAQEIGGRVFSNLDMRPLEQVSVFLQNTSIGTVTNEHGYFQLIYSKKIKDNDSLVFQYLGYEKRIVKLKDFLKNNSEISLNEASQELGEVTVNASLKINKKLRPIELSTMQVPLSAFDVSFDEAAKKVYIIGGDESYAEQNIKSLLLKNPRLTDPAATLADLIQSLGSNLNWQHFSDRVYSYNFDTDSWQEVDCNLTERAYHNTIIKDDKIYVLGGKRLTNNMKREYLVNDIEVIDLENEKVEVDKTNPHQAVNHGSVVFNNNLIVFGGSTKINFNGQPVYTDQVHLYDFSSGYWYELAPITEPKETNGVVVGDKIYLIGGENNRIVKEIEVYDIVSGLSYVEASLFEGLKRPGIAVEGEVIYILEKGKLFTYDTNERILNEYLVDDLTENPKIVIKDGYLYAFGGFYFRNFVKFPTKNVYKLNLSELSITKINRSQSFVQPNWN